MRKMDWHFNHVNPTHSGQPNTKKLHSMASLSPNLVNCYLFKNLYSLMSSFSPYTYSVHWPEPIGWLCLQLDCQPSVAELFRLLPLKSRTLHRNTSSQLSRCSPLGVTWKRFYYNSLS